MLKWENVMAPLAGTYSDCTLVLHRLQRVLDEFPWLAPRLRPAIEETQDIRAGIEETLKGAFHFWNGNYRKPLKRSGFDNPEESKIM
jgi:hypothetical protein